MKFNVQDALNHPLVQVKRAGSFRVLKYKRKVFFDGLWDDVLVHARGLVLNDNDEVVVRPFVKIFNYGVEKQAPKLNDQRIVYAQRKVNGFMLSLTRLNGELVFATTGDVWSASVSPVSKNDFINMAKELVDAELAAVTALFDFYETSFTTQEGEKPSVTLMFEAVHRNDPHIVPEVEGLYFLAAHVNKRVYFPLAEKDYGMKAAGAFLVTFGELCKMARTCKHEGFVVRDTDGTLLTKIKSPFYLINKFLARSGAWKRVLESENKRQAYSLVDEEYYSLVDFIFENKEAYSTMSEQEKLSFLRTFYQE